MIPGLEYEHPPSGNGGFGPSIASPSGRSMSSVEMSPRAQNDDRYHLQQLRRRPAASGYDGGAGGGYGASGNGSAAGDDKYAKRA